MAGLKALVNYHSVVIWNNNEMVNASNLSGREPDEVIESLGYVRISNWDSLEVEDSYWRRAIVAEWVE